MRLYRIIMKTLHVFGMTESIRFAGQEICGTE